jgi:HSP20 family molecular chaperone IbpA
MFESEMFKSILKNIPNIIAEEIKKIDIEVELNKLKDLYNSTTKETSKEEPKETSKTEEKTNVIVTEPDDLGKYEIICEMPGISKKNISVQLNKGVLSIDAEQNIKKFNYEFIVNDNKILHVELKLGILTIKLQEMCATIVNVVIN